jgi:hypothetical protein
VSVVADTLPAIHNAPATLFKAVDLIQFEDAAGAVQVHVWRDDPAQTDYSVDVDRFNSSPLALVIADVTIRNAIGQDIMRAAA